MSQPAWRRYARFHHDDVDADLDDEFSAHLALLVDAHLAAGMSRAAAESAARAAFRHADAAMEECRKLTIGRLARDRRREQLTKLQMDAQRVARERPRATGDYDFSHRRHCRSRRRVGNLLGPSARTAALAAPAPETLRHIGLARRLPDRRFPPNHWVQALASRCGQLTLSTRRVSKLRHPRRRNPWPTPRASSCEAPSADSFARPPSPSRRSSASPSASERPPLSPARSTARSFNRCRSATLTGSSPSIASRRTRAPLGTWPQSPANYSDLATSTKSIETLSAVTFGTALVDAGGGGIQASQLYVTGGLFDMLGAHAARGRLLVPDDDRLDTPGRRGHERRVLAQAVRR